jgi:hypothetical protein
MPDDDRAQKPENRGVVVPISGVRTISFAERASRSEALAQEKAEPVKRKLVHRPRLLPECGKVDPLQILNRKDAKDDPKE